MFLLALYKLARDRYRLSVEARLSSQFGKYVKGTIKFTVTVRNRGERQLGIESVVVRGKAKWFPDTPYNPFHNGEVIMFQMDASTEAVVLKEGESRLFEKAFDVDTWKSGARKMKAYVRTTLGETKKAGFKT